MSYWTVGIMAQDYALTQRITAAAAKESIDRPDQWAQQNRWEVASQPGWDGAWESAVAGGIENPGMNDAVITDGMILSGVQAVVAANTPPDPEV